MDIASPVMGRLIAPPPLSFPPCFQHLPPRKIYTFPPSLLEQLPCRMDGPLRIFTMSK